MGVPRLFSWLAERYPLSQRVIDGSGGDSAAGKSTGWYPEMDNFYLDMNGIIHKCTHGQPNVVLTEEEMVQAIFAYIEKLFVQVRPRHLLYVAVDGVAPRAKMNQQRSRRFKAAVLTEKEQARLRSIAEAAGTAPPPLNHFDSNCITPGTDFMVRLSVRLRAFLEHKLVSDPLWHHVKVIYSGHEVPGEGEHKIQQFMRDLLAGRAASSAPIRHCMYGLDADLIVLGLVSHEPNFCLIFEDVHSPESRVTQSSERAQNFRMMYLSLLREYLDMEFQQLDRRRNPQSPMTFDYSLDRVLDDVVVLSYFVGNDFLPNIPSLYIPAGALDVIFDAYKRVLPSLDGYIQTGQSPTAQGTFRLDRMMRVLEALVPIEFEMLRVLQQRARHRRSNGKPAAAAASLLSPVGATADNGRATPEVAALDMDVVTSEQLVIARLMRDFALDLAQTSLALPASLGSLDRIFAMRLADVMELQTRLVGHENELHVVVLRRADEDVEDESEQSGRDGIDAVEDAVTDADVAVEDAGAPTSAGTPDAVAPLSTAMKQLRLPASADGAAATELLETAKRELEGRQRKLDQLIAALAERTRTSGGDGSVNGADADLVDDDARNVRESIRRYYIEKFNLKDDDQTEWQAIRDRMCTSFLQGVQWTLSYYYVGVASWSWYYPFHYAPFLADLLDFFRNRFFAQMTPPQTYEAGAQTYRFTFELGQPFLPLQQLLAVLPPRSAPLIPDALQPLMLLPTSPIVDFYPKSFASDMNEKKKDWEAVALIPFIDERRLLDAMAPLLVDLRPAEHERNKLRPAATFMRVINRDSKQPLRAATVDYRKPAPWTAPAQSALTASANWAVRGGDDSPRSRSPGTTVPSMHLTRTNVNFAPELVLHNMLILRQSSKRDAIILRVSNQRFRMQPTLAIAAAVLGSKCYIDWPHCKEAFCSAVLDTACAYEMHVNLEKQQLEISATEHTSAREKQFRRDVQHIVDQLSFRRGIVLDEVTVLLRCQPLAGLQTRADGSTVKHYAPPELAVLYPVQLVVDAVAREDQRFVPEPAPALTQRFADGSSFLYVDPTEYQSPTDPRRTLCYFGCMGLVKSVEEASQTLTVMLNTASIADRTWVFAQNEAGAYYQRRGYITFTQIARELSVTGSVLIRRKEGAKVNVGLAIKHTKRGLKVMHVTAFSQTLGWMASPTAVALIASYLQQFAPIVQRMAEDTQAGTYDEHVLFKERNELPAMLMWLQKSGVRDLELVSIHSEEFDVFTVSAIQVNQATAHARLSKTRPLMEVYNNIYPHLLVQSHVASTLLADQTFMLGDRVVSTGAYLLPLGLKGVVVKLFAPETDEPARITQGADPRVGVFRIRVSLDTMLPSGVRTVDTPPFAFLNLAGTIRQQSATVVSPLALLQEQPRVCTLRSVGSS